jgi:hypothetical protein
MTSDNRSAGFYSMCKEGVSVHPNMKQRFFDWTYKNMSIGEDPRLNQFTFLASPKVELTICDHHVAKMVFFDPPKFRTLGYASEL